MIPNRRNLMILGDCNKFDEKQLSLDLSLGNIVDKPTRVPNILTQSKYSFLYLVVMPSYLNDPP